MRDLLVLSRGDVTSILNIRDAIELVENAFAEYGHGRAGVLYLPPFLPVAKNRGEIEIKSGFIEKDGIGTKIITYYPDNVKVGLPPVAGVIVLNDIRNGKPIAVFEGTYITAIRTGAAGAVAAKYLARKESRNIAIIGTGAQGRTQLAGLKQLFKIATVKAYDILVESAKRFCEEMSRKHGLDVVLASGPRDAVENADIVVMTSRGTEPVVMHDWIREGTHINAIGADAPGKQELDVEILVKAKIVVDNMAQCKERGEIQTAIARQIIDESDIHAELGDVVAGRKMGRQTNKEITIFDATGLMIQDIAVCQHVYQIARRKNVGTRVALI